MIKKYLKYQVPNVILLLLVTPAVFSQNIPARKIKKMFEKSEILNEHFTGFALFDQDKDKMVFEQNGSKHFIPASNTKTYTFYTALEMLGDSIPALKYITKSDSLIFWGTGDPTLAYSTFKSNKVLDFLKKSDKKLFFVATNYKVKKAGNGLSF